MILVKDLVVGRNYSYDLDTSMITHVTCVERVDHVRWHIVWDWTGEDTHGDQILTGNTELHWTPDDDDVPL